MSAEDFEDERYLRIYVPERMSLDNGWELEALIDTVEEAMKAARNGRETETFEMIVEVPADLDVRELDKLFEAIATAAHDFEDRFPERTWNVFVAGGALSEEHSVEAAFERVCDENEQLRDRLAVAKNRAKSALENLLGDRERYAVESILAALEVERDV